LEADANAITDHGGADAPDDWDRLNPLRPGFVPPNPGPSHASLSVFVLDGLDSTIFTTGGSKDVNDINIYDGPDTTHNWMWTNGNVPDKDNLVDAYAALYILGDTTYLFFGADRYANNGDAQIGFWFFKNEITINEDGTFNGVHTIGDVLLLSDFTGGGGVSTIRLFRWVGPPDADNLEEIAPLPSYQAYAAVNSTDQTSPWDFQDKFGDANIFAHGELYEGGVNLTALLGGDICFSSFLSETRSSQSLDAQLKDFALHNFPSAPTVTVNDDEVCTGFAGELCPTITGGFGPFTFSWTGPNGFASFDSCINPTDAGTYTVTVTGGNNCVGEGSGTLTVNPQPVCDITGDNEICTGFTTEFCATAGMTSYLWSGPEDNGATTQCITIGTAGEYTVVITDANGCADTCSRTLMVDPQPVCDITGDNEICTGFTTEFCATAGMTSYLWSGPEDNGATTQCITIGTAGEYTVIITDANGCADTCSRTLTVQSQPVCNITGDDEICAGFTTEFCATEGMASYLWSGPEDDGATTQCITVGTAGEYTVIITATGGCADTCSRTLIVDPQPVCNITGDNEICTGFTTEFCATAGMTSYLWSGPEDDGATTQCITIGTAGEYTVIITDANGCADTCSRTLIVDPQPDCAITPPETTVCEGSTATFCSNPSGGTPPYSFLWEGPSGFSSGDSCITVGDAGTYQIIITDANSCADTCEATLTTEVCGQVFCGLTQGAYGNAGGNNFGMGTLELIQFLIDGTPIVVGKPGRSVQINLDAAQCIIDRLPGVGTPRRLPPQLGDAVLDPTTCQTTPPLPLREVDGAWKFENVLLGQTIALSLNVRLACDLGSFTLCNEFVTVPSNYGPDGEICTGDDFSEPGPVGNFAISQAVLDALSSLGLPGNVSGLLELANRALGGWDTGGATLSQINDAVDAINRGFDECRFVVCCSEDCWSTISGKTPEKEQESLAKFGETGQLIPDEFFLSQSYPNPFNATAMISYGLPQAAQVTIDIYDLLGRKVMTLVDEGQQAGYHQVVWNAGAAPSGVYFYIMKAGEFTDTKKMVLTK
jgi:hypothetical protein